VFECQCWKALLETAENKNDEKLFMVLISLQVEQTCERVCVKGCNSGASQRNSLATSCTAQTTEHVKISSAESTVGRGTSRTMMN